MHPFCLFLVLSVGLADIKHDYVAVANELFQCSNYSCCSFSAMFLAYVIIDFLLEAVHAETTRIYLVPNERAYLVVDWFLPISLMLPPLPNSLLWCYCVRVWLIFALVFRYCKSRRHVTTEQSS